MITDAFDAFIAPARAKPQLWRLLVGLAIVAASFVLWYLAILLILYLLAGDSALEWVARSAQADTPTSALIVLAMFGGLMVGAMLAARLLHKRPFLSVFGPPERLLRGLLTGFLIAAAVFALSSFMPLGYEPIPNLEFSLWLSFLPLALLAVLIQTGAEEVLFRGYIQQQMAARFNSRLMWLVLPSILFGALHFSPAAPLEFSLLNVGVATLFGLFAADLTAKSGSIGAAWGFHFANNTVALLIVSLNGPLSGLALYVTPFGPEAVDILAPLLVWDILLTTLIWGAIRYVVSR